MCQAFLNQDTYLAQAPEPVGELKSFLPSIHNESKKQPKDRGAALLGFDFPIGIPIAYANNAGIEDFKAFLADLGTGPWQDFYSICREPGEISLHRPFYPFNFTPKGSKRREHLVQALKVPEFAALLRTCERAQSGRRAAGALFWTLGASAPGRGALPAWKHILTPALANPAAKFWPFDGSLADLLRDGNLVIAETYPTHYYSALLGAMGGSKRDPRVRASAAPRLLQWAEEKSVCLSPELEREIATGFTRGQDDAFDAAIGLFGMIEVVLGHRAAGQHPDSGAARIEGWILGQ
jgi:hypothetical protein